MIYFIQDAERYSIKIGYAKTDVEERRLMLQTGNPSVLVVLLIIEGNREKEAELHQQFKKYRRQGEWFDPAPELLAFIMLEAVGAPRQIVVHAERERDEFCPVCTGPMDRHQESGCPIRLWQEGTHDLDAVPKKQYAANGEPL